MAKPRAGGADPVQKRKSLRTSPVAKTKASKAPKKRRIITTTKIVAPIHKKGRGKKIAVTSLRDEARKIKIIENIAKRSPQPVAESEITKDRVLLDLKERAFRSLSSVSLDHAQIASSVARYAGTAFVIIGSIFTFYNVGHMLTPPSGSGAALTLGGVCEGSDCPQVVDTLSSGTTNMITEPVPGPTVTPDTKPDADFKVDASGSVLTGMVPVNVTVALAKRVDLVAKNNHTNAVVQIGSMTKVGDLVWRAYWQTNSFDDGTYTLKAVIVNEYGSYTKEHPSSYTVMNYPVDTVTQPQETNSGSETGTTTRTVTASSTPVTADILPEMKVELGTSGELHGTVKIRANVIDATSVKVFAREVNAQSSVLLGNATLHAPGEWRFEWDTKKVADGMYDLRIQAIFLNEKSRTETIRNLTVLNANSVTSTSSPETVEAELEPSVTIRLTKQNPLSGKLDIYLVTSKLDAVEMYVLPEKTLVPKFVGKAERQSDAAWRYRFDTTRLPNGSYEMYALVKHAYGKTESGHVSIRIENPLDVKLTPQHIEYVGSLEKTGEEVKEIIKDTHKNPASDTVSKIDESSPYDEITNIVPEEYKSKASDALASFKKELESTMKEYSKALRENNEEQVRTVQSELEGIRERVLLEMPRGEDQDSLIAKVNDSLSRIIEDQSARVARSEALIRERIGEAATKDSDQDGITDYDEVNIYSTNPFTADTDQDGFTDGVEILNGFDPIDSTKEANVLYESPKDRGIVRDDLLTIDHLTTVAEPDEESAPKAHIGGRALPRSFVTLYIFSTPIIVTVKTDDNGNWSYIFDKELENGEHQMYVGITDNAGKIVAKSNPLNFVKTAEAFTPVGADAGAVLSPTVAEPSLISDNSLYAVASLAVVSLGLVLILLGLHVRPKESEMQFA